ncbi:MAG: hypothetical protein K2N91_04730 [Muribaculaceae bacterium]|nr:hypothetical protein [Muribaculaceae bacterium]
MSQDCFPANIAHPRDNRNTFSQISLQESDMERMASAVRKRMTRLPPTVGLYHGAATPQPPGTLKDAPRSIPTINT